LIELVKLYELLIIIHVSIFILVNLLLLYLSRRTTNIKKNENNQFSVGMIIPCYNEEAIIKRKLTNSIDISRPSKSFMIYVVDDGSADNTFKIANEFKQLNRLENIFVWKNPGKKGKIRALNWVFNKIREDIIVITDADVLLEKSALVRLIANFDNPTVGAVTGKVVINKQGKEFTAKTEDLYRKLYDVWRRAESNLESCSIPNGSLMAFRKQVLQKVRIDENMQYDDISLLFKTRRLGYRAVYEPEALFYETVDPSFLQQMKRKIRRANALTHVLLRNLGVIGRYGSFGRVIYPISIYNHVICPILTLILLLLSPVIVLRYPVILLLSLLLLVPIIRILVVGFITAQIALVMGLVMLEKGRWETTHT